MKHLSIVLAVTASMVFISACKKTKEEPDTGPKIPKVITLPVTNITSTSAVGGGYCYDNGGDTITKRGVCFSHIITKPDYENGFHTLDGQFSGVFSSPLTPLLPNTTYYLRAYAENKVGLGYGEIISFKTLP